MRRVSARPRARPRNGHPCSTDRGFEHQDPGIKTRSSRRHFWSLSEAFALAKNTALRIAIVSLSIALIPMQVFGQAARQDSITLELGTISFTFEKRLLIGRPSPRPASSLSREQWNAATHYAMSFGQSISVELRNSFPARLMCGNFRSAVLHRVRFNPDVRTSVDDWEAAPTENARISRLIPPPDIRALPIQGADKTDAYQFEDDDLRDFRGGKQQFVHGKDVFPGTPSIVRMGIRLAPEITVNVSFSSSLECFLRDGPELTRYVRNFFVQRMKNSP
jgi:hypothetical protein